MPPRGGGAGSDRSRAPRPPGPRSWHSTSEEERSAGASLLHHLLDLYGRCKMTAKDFCIACWHCNRAGTSGAVFALYAVDPQSETGAFQRHLDKVLPLAGEMLYVDAPMSPGRSIARTTVSVPMRCLWESLEEECASDPTILATLRAEPQDREQCVLDVPAYRNRPEVEDARLNGRTQPPPLAFY
eukprot:7775293-Pyramimonas_sp.AAC.1